MANENRDTLIKPRQLNLASGTLQAKLASIIAVGDGTTANDVAVSEIFTTALGHAFIATATDNKIVNATNDGTINTKLLPIMTPIDILPKFAAPSTLGTGENILFHTADTRNSAETNTGNKVPDTNGKFKQISLYQLKDWMTSAITGDVGKVKTSTTDDRLAFLNQKITAGAIETGKPIGTAVTIAGAITDTNGQSVRVTAHINMNSTHFGTQLTGAACEYYIKSINGGTI